MQRRNLKYRPRRATEEKENHREYRIISAALKYFSAALCGLIFFVSIYSLIQLKFQIYLSSVYILKVNTTQSE